MADETQDVAPETTPDAAQAGAEDAPPVLHRITHPISVTREPNGMVAISQHYTETNWTEDVIVQTPEQATAIVASLFAFFGPVVVAQIPRDVEQPAPAPGSEPAPSARRRGAAS